MHSKFVFVHAIIFIKIQTVNAANKRFMNIIIRLVDLRPREKSLQKDSYTSQHDCGKNV